MEFDSGSTIFIAHKTKRRIHCATTGVFKRHPANYRKLDEGSNMFSKLWRKIVLGLGLLAGQSFGAEEPKLNIPGAKENIEFSAPGGVSLTLDAHVPDGPGPFATCILVHGGGWINGNKRVYITPLFEPLTKAGFVWFTINYRLAPAHRWPDCGDDVTAAVKWVKAHAAEYKVDPKRIALIGESAGAHLVAWVGTQNDPETRVAAVVPFYLPGDLELQTKKTGKIDAPLVALLNVTELDDAARKTLRAASPIDQIKPGLPPFLLIHGDHDVTVPYEQSTLFQAKMKAAGNVCDLITIPGGAHGMGGWDKLKSDYREQLEKWLHDKIGN